MQLTTGQVAAGANIRFETFRVWIRRYPDQFATALFGLDQYSTAPGEVVSRADRAWAWRRFSLRDALLLDIIGLLVGFGSGPDTALRFCENLSHELGARVWPIGHEGPNLSGRPMLLLYQKPHLVKDPDEIARGKMPSRARWIRVEHPGQPFTPMEVRPAEELIGLLQNEEEFSPALVVDLAREWAAVQARLARSRTQT